MIYTVTFNPSLDYIVSVRDFQLGKTNRTTYELLLPGGKGINVSMVLSNLGIANKALGFIAGSIGDEIEKRAAEAGVDCEFIRLPAGISRINVKMRDFEGTEINGTGPEIDENSIEALYDQLKQLQKGDILVLAGSIPDSLPHTIYKDLMFRCREQEILFVVDATKELLLEVLEYRPFLIKPNHHELGELFGVTLHTREGVIPYAKKLQEMGARNVLVSMAGEGAVLVDENQQIHILSAPKGEVVNAVGAGDSMVAGFLAGWEETKEFHYAFKMGIAAGSASAFSEMLAKRDFIQHIYQMMDEDACPAIEAF